MNNRIIVDCDQTVVNSAYAWYLWLEKKTNANFTYSWVSATYDFSIPYGPIWASRGLSGSPLDFWRERHLYDDIQPIEGSVEALKTLHNDGYDICFVSQIKGDHFKSKYQMLKRNFPFMAAYAATKEKWLFSDCTMVIEDRNSMLNMFDNPETLRVKRNTPHDQDEILRVGLDYTLYEWEDFQEWLLNVL